jgi:large subunit ribosomal protein L1
VTEDIFKAIKEFSSGKTEFKNDDTGNVHLGIGKTDFETNQLEANLKAFIEALLAAKPAGLKKEYVQGAFIHATMGPSIKIKL